MLEDKQIPEHGHLERLLEAMNSDIGASELHGVFSGLICAGTSETAADWITAFFENWPAEDLLAQEARELIGQLYFTTKRQIAHDDYPFMPLLPDEADSIVMRAKGLSEWCEGYLYALGLAGVTEGSLSGDAKEAIEDLSHFTRLNYEDLESGEATELAYMELQEFIKVVTLLMWEELIENRGEESADE